MFKKKIATSVKYLGNRNKFLTGKVSNKNIIHLGCTDWPFAEEEVINNRLLHSKLADQANFVLGIDIDEKGVNYLEKMSRGSFEVGDVSQQEFCEYLLRKYSKVDWDYILVPDVLEHVKNQERFLQGVITLMSKFDCGVIFTTPNQYSLKAFLGTIIRWDFTHTDHRLVHNETTLIRSIMDVGMGNLSVSFDYCSYDVARRYGLGFQVLSRAVDGICFFAPQWSDCIIVYANGSPKSFLTPITA